MPCSEDHEVSQRPLVSFAGAGSDAEGLSLLRDLLGFLLDEAEREGCLLGIGECALEEKDDETVGSRRGSVEAEEEELISADPPSIETKRRVLGRRVAELSVEAIVGCLGFMAA